MPAHALQPDDAGDCEAPAASTRAGAVREHSLLALVELNRELSVHIDARRVVDLVLFNLMGHFGTPQSAIWLASAAPGGGFEMVRGYGMPASLGAALGAAFDAHVSDWSLESPEPLEINRIGRRLDPASLAAAENAGVALIAPLPAHGAIIGFVALGRRGDGRSPSAFELEVLGSSLSMVGVAIENSRLYHELQERNRSLAEAYRDLTELDQMKTEFIQNVNHELRTPLAVIMGSVELLSDPPDPDPLRQNLLVAIRDHTAKLTTMVHSILELDSIVSHEQGASSETVDLAALIGRYALQRTETVAAGGRTLTVIPTPDRTTARVAPIGLHKALDLLLDNAVKFTPEGTQITLAVQRSVDGSWVCLTFRDDGPGIPSDQLSRVFRPFFQVDGSATRASGGLGIGLAIVQRLLTSMGGRIEAENPQNGGTEFRILLPASEAIRS